MFPVSVKISAIISGAKFAQAFQIHPVFLVKTGNADDSVQATEYAQAPGLPKGCSNLLPKPHQIVVPSSSAKQEDDYEKTSRNTEIRELGQSLSTYYMENYVTFKRKGALYNLPKRLINSRNTATTNSIWHRSTPEVGVRA
jgi:hypothetical protein